MFEFNQESLNILVDAITLMFYIYTICKQKRSAIKPTLY